MGSQGRGKEGRENERDGREGEGGFARPAGSPEDFKRKRQGVGTRLEGCGPGVSSAPETH